MVESGVERRRFERAAEAWLAAERRSVGQREEAGLKLEYFEDAYEGRAVLLFHSPLSQEAAALRAEFAKLSQSEDLRISLHELAFIEPAGGCTLVAVSARREIGVRPSPRPPNFEWILSLSSWDNAEGLLEPFCAPPVEHARFQYLNPARGPEVIFSTTRSW